MTGQDNEKVTSKGGKLPVKLLQWNLAQG